MMRRAIALLPAALALTAGGAQAASPVEQEIQSLFWTVTWFAIGVSIVVYGALFWFLIRYRQSASPPRPDHIEGSRKVEAMWTVVPTIILVIISIISTPVLFFTDVPPPVDTVVEVVASQFTWTFNYEDGSTTLGEVWIREGTVVLFQVTSLDVIHSFTIPELGIKIDAVPGRYTSIWVQGDVPGQYLVQCAEFCGVGHYGMRARIHIFPASEARLYGPPSVPVAVTNVELREFAGNPWSIVPSNLTSAIGAQLYLRIWNNNSNAHDFRIDPPVDLTVDPIAPFSSAWLNFTLTSSSGDPIAYGPTDPTARANGMVGALIVQAGRVVPVLLDDSLAGSGHAWAIDPPFMGFEPGETVTFELRNVGSVPHNFRMDPPYDHIFYEDLIEPGESVFYGPFTLEAEALGAYWCDVPGHRQLGMEGEVRVGEGGPLAVRGLPLYDMTLITFIAGGIAMFAYVVHHARREE